MRKSTIEWKKYNKKRQEIKLMFAFGVPEMKLYHVEDTTPSISHTSNPPPFTKSALKTLMLNQFIIILTRRHHWAKEREKLSAGMSSPFHLLFYRLLFHAIHIEEMQ